MQKIGLNTKFNIISISVCLIVHFRFFSKKEADWLKGVTGTCFLVV